MEGSGWPEALPRPGNQGLERLPSNAPWFEAYKVGAGTFALLEPRHYEEVISYLILGADRAVLLDTGMGIGDISAEVARLTDLPVVVVNSHSHYDHVGDNHRFAEVWAFDEQMEVAHIEQGLGPAEAALFIPPEHFLRDARERFFPPGNVVALQQHLLEVRHAHGHRRCHVLIAHRVLRCCPCVITTAAATVSDRRRSQCRAGAGGSHDDIMRSPIPTSA